jgi:phosphonoacetaldehyde hydrolase
MTQVPSQVRAVLVDWAGTTIDYGSRAPTSVFLEIFSQSGIGITAEEARGPMGMAKREHIATLLQLTRIAKAWKEQFGQSADDADVDRLYEQFLPLQRATLANHCDLIPGVVETIDILRRAGIRIGSTTGYTRHLMDVVEPIAAEHGYAPDVVICSDEVAAGRPAPWSNFRAAERLGVYPVSEIVVVDDTVAGIEAGRNGGMWTVAVTQTGNALGLSQAEVNALSPPELARRLAAAESQFFAAGAHYCLRSIADLPRLLASFHQ